MKKLLYLITLTLDYGLFDNLKTLKCIIKQLIDKKSDETKESQMTKLFILLGHKVIKMTKGGSKNERITTNRAQNVSYKAIHGKSGISSWFSLLTK